MKNIIRVVFLVGLLAAGVKLQDQEPPIYIAPRSGNLPQRSIIFIHGLGGSAQSYFNMFNKASTSPVDDNTRVVLPNAPLRPQTSRGGQIIHSWFDILDGNFSPSSFSEEDIEESARYLGSLVDIEAQRYGGDYSKVFIGGCSQGCIMSLFTALGFHNQLGGIMCNYGLLMPTVNLINKNTPITISHGTADTTIPYTIAMKSYEPIKSWPSIQFHTFPGVGHGLTDEMRTVMKDFWQQYALKQSGPQKPSKPVLQTE